MCVCICACACVWLCVCRGSAGIGLEYVLIRHAYQCVCVRVCVCVCRNFVLMLQGYDRVHLCARERTGVRLASLVCVGWWVCVCLFARDKREHTWPCWFVWLGGCMCVFCVYNHIYVHVTQIHKHVRVTHMSMCTWHIWTSEFMSHIWTRLCTRHIWTGLYVTHLNQCEYVNVTHMNESRHTQVYKFSKFIHGSAVLLTEVDTLQHTPTRCC